MEQQLKDFAEGRATQNLTIVYSDMHGLWGGVTVTLSTSGAYERLERTRSMIVPDKETPWNHKNLVLIQKPPRLEPDLDDRQHYQSNDSSYAGMNHQANQVQWSPRDRIRVPAEIRRRYDEQRPKRP
jgi:hypothetical protein